MTADDVAAIPDTEVAVDDECVDLCSTEHKESELNKNR
jgi:hypothetical protein